MSARDTLASFVAAGNLRDAEPSPTMDVEKAKQLRERVEALRNNGGKAPSAEDTPSDFRANIAAREQKAAADVAAQRGLDVPRPGATNAILKRIYGVHDAISTMPAPGGLGLILFIIFVFFLILIPITTSGETRALLLWDVLLGQKQVTANNVTAPAPPEPKASPAAATGMGSMRPMADSFTPPLALIADVAPALSAIGMEGY